MLKKIITLIAISCLPITAFAVISDRFSTGSNSAGDNMIRCDTNGTWYNYNPYYNVPFVISAPETASQTAYFNFSVSTATIIAAATTYTLANADYTDVITPRNLVIISSVNAGATYSGTALVTGVNAVGEATTETITVSTNSTVYGTGLVAWSTVTSVKFTSTATTATAMKFQIGSGNALGLPCKLTSSTTEVLKVIENKALISPSSYSVNFSTVTYNTYTPTAVSDGSKNYIIYLRPSIR